MHTGDLLQGVKANVRVDALQGGNGEQSVEALRNAVVELAKLRQMVESDDAALEACYPNAATYLRAAVSACSLISDAPR